MSKKEQVPHRQCTDEFKLEAVKLAESVGGNEAAERVGILDSSLWQQNPADWPRRLVYVQSRLGQSTTAESGAAKEASQDG